MMPIGGSRKHRDAVPWFRHVARGVCVSLVILVLDLGPMLETRLASAGHGGVVQVNRGPAGPSALSVWTQPSPPTPGPWQVDVAVMRDGSVPVTDACVRVRAEPLVGGARPVETDAHRDADPLGVRYRASL